MQRLIIKEMKKRRFFGTSKLEINVTDTGLKMLNSKKQELHQQAEQLRQWKRSGDTTQLQSYMNSDNNRSWVPVYVICWNYGYTVFHLYYVHDGNDTKSDGKSNGYESGGGGTDGAGETDSSGAGASEADTGGGDFGGFDGGGFGDF